MEKCSQYICEFRAFKVLILTTNFQGLLGIILVLLSLLSSCLSQSPTGFLSINCGGNGLKDSFTGIDWVSDDRFLDSADELMEEGVTVRATVIFKESRASSRDNAEQLRTAMAFIPEASSSSRSKYCYNFNVALSNKDSTNYLIRAMFPSKNLTPTNESIPKDMLTKYSRKTLRWTPRSFQQLS